jgi:hypothetical protein
MYHLAEFNGLKVGKHRIKQQNFVRMFTQTFQCLGSTGGLGQIPWGLIEFLSQIPAEPAVRAYEKHTC